MDRNELNVPGQFRVKQSVPLARKAEAYIENMHTEYWKVLEFQVF